MDVYFVEAPAPHAEYRDIAEVRYVGVTDVSVEIHTINGTHYRITNPDFMRGLTTVILNKQEDGSWSER